MIFKNISVLCEEEILESMCVGVKNGKIEYISDQEPEDLYEFGEIYEGSNRLLIPGLCNAHMHSPMSLQRGYAENLSLDKWLNEKVFPFEDKLTNEAVYYGTLLQIAEMLRFGTTSFSDMYFLSDNTARAVIKSGIKCNLSTSVVGFDENMHFNETGNYNNIKNWYNEFNDADNGRLKIDFSLHAEYTSRPKLVSEFSEECRKYGAVVQVHISETEKEHEECIARHGKTPTEYFYSLGLFENKTVAAHCVYVTEQDMDIMSENGVSVAHCPVSNLKLASGVADVKKLLNKNVNVALGTDSVASNNSGNLFEELKLAAILHKGITKDPAAISPLQAIKMATKNGYIAQNRNMEIKVGNAADLAVVNIDCPHMYPRHNLINNLVYSAQGSDVVLTMVNGQVLYRDGDFLTLDIRKIQFEANRIALSLA